MGVKKDILWRIWLAYLVVVLFGFAIIVKAVTIQYKDGEKYRAMADSANLRYETIEAERGNIFTEKGHLLAASFPYFTLVFDPLTPSKETFNNNIDSVCLLLAKNPGGRTPLEWKKKLSNARRAGSRYVVLARRVPLPDMQQIKSYPLFRQGRFRGGLIVEAQNRRKNPYEVLAFRTVGYSKPDIHVGLEGMFDKELAGQSGKRLLQRMAGNSYMPVNEHYEIEPVHGSDIITTIDIALQDVVENALERSLISNDAEHGCALVMEVKTGKVLAIANLTRIKEGKYDERSNYAVGEATEPGSTFKLASAIALLESGLELTDTVDLHKGLYRFHDRRMYDSDYPNKYRSVSFEEAFARSSNVGISRLATRQFKKDREAFVGSVQRMGLTHLTGIEIPGEAAPFFKEDISKWSGVSLPWMSVGYELRLTPLQVLCLYNAVANEGKLMKPYLVSSIYRDGEITRSFEPTVLEKRIASEKTIQDARKLLEAVVEYGTAKRLRDADYTIAGKTGTARISNSETAYADRVYQASFAGYFPADDPVYSCIVVVNNPSNGRFYGSSVAGPVFKEISDKLYSTNLQLQPIVAMPDSLRSEPTTARGYRKDLETVYAELNSPFNANPQGDWMRVKSTDSILYMQPLPIDQALVPDVRGMSLKDALYLLENSGIKVRIDGFGKVKRQSVRGGTPIRTGTVIKLDLG